jgi:hypothetical protein
MQIQPSPWLETEPADFLALPAAEQKRFREMATNALANEIYRHVRAAALESEARAESLKARAARDLSEREKNAAAILALDLSQLGDQVRFFSRIGGVAFYGKDTNIPFGGAFANADQHLEAIKRQKLTRYSVALDHGRAVFVVASPERIAGFGLPDTITFSLEDGRHAAVFASQSRSRAHAYHGPGWKICWQLDFGPDCTFSSPKVDESTGELPAVGKQIDRYLLQFDTRPELLAEVFPLT